MYNCDSVGDSPLALCVDEHRFHFQNAVLLLVIFRPQVNGQVQTRSIHN